MDARVYGAHKSGGAVREAKWHGKTPIDAISSDKSGFLLRHMIHWDLVGDEAKVELTKEARFAKKDQRLGDQREGCFICVGDGVRLAVADALAILAIEAGNSMKVLHLQAPCSL